MKNKKLLLFISLFFSFLTSILLFSGCTAEKSLSEEHLSQLLTSLLTPLTQEEYQQWEEFTEETNGSLSLTKNKKDITLQIEGTAQIDKDGKITHLEFYGMDQLIEAFS